jgi:hypothetical protein
MKNQTKSAHGNNPAVVPVETREEAVERYEIK